METERERVMAQLRASFRPEFLNRLDDIVVFQRLGKEHILSIVDLQLAEFAKRLHRHADYRQQRHLGHDHQPNRHA